MALAYIHKSRGDLDAARRRLEEAQELDPGSAAVVNGLGLLRSQLGEREDAVRSFERAIALAPDNPAPWLNLGHEYRLLGRYDEGIRASQEAARIDPREPNAWKNLGNNYYFKGRLLEARDTFAKLVDLKPNHAMGHFNLAATLEALGELGELDDAARHYEQAIALDPGDVRWPYNLGNLYVRLRRLDDAVAAYGKALATAPDHAWTHYNLADALRELGRLDEAAKHFAEALRLDPGDHEAPLSLAAVLVLKGEAEKARAHAARDLGMLREKAAAPGAGAADLAACARALITCEPEDLRDAGAALALAEKAAQASRQKDPAVLETLAMALHETGDAPRAVAVLEQALALLPPPEPGKPAPEPRPSLEARLAEYRAAPGAGERR
ncbi:MAG: tetratricopeptide repeat protein [Planctomycetes bacterium]|nr:tetratricopeptide repeat protein [Planctomycetota bacterium]